MKEKAYPKDPIISKPPSIVSLRKLLSKLQEFVFNILFRCIFVIFFNSGWYTNNLLANNFKSLKVTSGCLKYIIGFIIADWWKLLVSCSIDGTNANIDGIIHTAKIDKTTIFFFGWSVNGWKTLVLINKLSKMSVNSVNHRHYGIKLELKEIKLTRSIIFIVGNHWRMLISAFLPCIIFEPFPSGCQKRL